MTEGDPRAILKAAGVECPAVEALDSAYGTRAWERSQRDDAAILALARLVAKYKWQRDYLHDLGEVTFADMERQWEERDA